MTLTSLCQILASENAPVYIGTPRKGADGTRHTELCLCFSFAELTRARRKHDSSLENNIQRGKTLTSLCLCFIFLSFFLSGSGIRSKAAWSRRPFTILELSASLDPLPPPPLLSPPLKRAVLNEPAPKATRAAGAGPERRGKS
jgi:hypothetical protein